jgi:hypothetical protein
VRTLTRIAVDQFTVITITGMIASTGWTCCGFVGTITEGFTLTKLSLHPETFAFSMHFFWRCTFRGTHQRHLPICDLDTPRSC